MRTIKEVIFTVNELSEDNKQNAFYAWLSNNECYSLNEGLDTLTEFCKLFSMTASGFDVGHQTYSITWNYELDDIKGKLAYRYMRQVWTGLQKPKTYYACRGVNGKLIHNCVGLNSITRVSKINVQADCPLTGVCYDYDILESIEKFLNKPYSPDISVNDVIRDCLESFMLAMQKAYEYETSIEYFKKEADNNNYEFYDNGERVY